MSRGSHLALNFPAPASATERSRHEGKGNHMRSNTGWFSAAVLLFVPLLAAAQDVDVPANLTMRSSTDGTVGNILKDGVPFIHNFGASNTFVGSNAGNLAMTGSENTATGAGALFSNT